MCTSTWSLLALAAAGFSDRAAAQALLPPPDRTPVLVLDHPGPHAPVTSVAFAPDGSALYVGGFDKQVRRFALDAGKYVPAGSFRVPIGNGNAGVVNAVAVSPDKKWVAVAGRAPIRGETWAGADDGISTDREFLPDLLKEDYGVVYLFDPTNPRGGRVIRGQRSEVRAVAFANPAPAGGPVLVTAGIEWDAAGKASGVVRAFDATTGRPVGRPLTGLPPTATPPGLGAWAFGPGNRGLRVAVAWDNETPKAAGELVVWEPASGLARKLPEPGSNAPLAVRVGKGGAAEVVTAGFSWQNGVGELRVRAADPTADPPRAVGRLVAPPGQGYLPLAIAAVGDATAVVVRVLPRPAGAATWVKELRVYDAAGKPVGKPVPLANLSDDATPVLAASADGRALAVGGFRDNRVEVFAAADLLAANPPANPQPQLLRGAAGGFDKVEFLAADKDRVRLWVGRADDVVAKGGVVLDPGARTAAPNDGNGRSDAPAPGPYQAAVIENPREPARVLVTAAGNPQGNRFLDLRKGERPTRAIVIPAKPAWNPALGPVAVVAHTDAESRQTLVTLFDAATGRRLLQLAGPTLEVRSLAASATLPLLAAAGDDGTVAVWSLRELRSDFAALDGVVLTEGDGGAVVASVRPGSRSAGKLAAGDVIEAVGPAKGDLKPVATVPAVVRAVRTFHPDDTIQVKVKGKPAGLVQLGAALGHRNPLFNLWVDPRPGAGGHDWVAWTPAGPYEANAEAAEARIVWLTATGNARQPVTLAPVGKYRGSLFKHGLIGGLLGPPPPPRRARPPVLAVSPTVPTREWNGRTVVREPAGLDVSLSDPDGVVLARGAVLRWRAVPRDGPPGPWKNEPGFAAGRATIDLSGHPWTRGDHRFEVAVPADPADPDGPAAAAVVFPVTYAPPAPALAVRVGDRPLPRGGSVATTEAEATVAGAAAGGPNGTDVTVVTNGPDADKAEVRRHLWGLLFTARVKLKPLGDPNTGVWVTAVNRPDGRGEAVDPGLEAASSDGVIRRDPPAQVAPPGVKLLLVSPHEPPAALGAPFLAPGPTATVAAVVDADPAAFAWSLDGGKTWDNPVPMLWLPGVRVAMREIPLPPATPAAVRVRARAANGPSGEDGLAVVYPGLPDARVKASAATVTAPEVALTGSLEGAGAGGFTLHVVVTPATRPAEPREFRVPNPAPGWQLTVPLTPGESRIDLVVANPWKTVRRAGAEVRYVRPPVVAGVRPVTAAGAVGDVTVTVLTPPGLPPAAAVRVNEQPARAQRGRVGTVFGREVWVLRAEGVPVVPPGAAVPPKAVRVSVGNAEGESRPEDVEVVQEKPRAAPPIVAVYHAGKAVPRGAGQPTHANRFAFEVDITSDTPLAQVRVWHTGPEGVRKPVAHAPVAVEGGGRKLVARAEVELRPGENHVRVSAENTGAAAGFEFKVVYVLSPVRVELDSIQDHPGGRAGKVDPEVPWAAAGPVVKVTGRVVWEADDDPVALDPNLRVVFVANGVAQVPVRVAEWRAGRPRVREFSGLVYAHAFDANHPGLTRVRVELRFGDRAGVVVQQGHGDAGFMVRSDKPLDKQRLHVIVVGVELTAADRETLVRRVIDALGGTYPDPNKAPAFGHEGGAFDRPGFVRATLYRPRVERVYRGDVLSLFRDVERAIEEATARPEEEWVNDVVVVYYQGEELLRGGRQFVHTSSSRQPNQTPTEVEDAAIRVDELRPVPGMLIGVFNVARLGQADGGAVQFSGGLPMIRFARKDLAGAAQLFPPIRDAVQHRRTFGDVAEALQAEVNKTPDRGGDLTTTLPVDHRGRVIGFGKR